MLFYLECSAAYDNFKLLLSINYLFSNLVNSIYYSLSYLFSKKKSQINNSIKYFDINGIHFLRTVTFFIFIVLEMATEDAFDQFDEEEQQVESQSFTKAGRKRLFSKELRCMMYGFGDDENPYTESVDILEDLVIEFITEMTHNAMEIGRSGRVQVEDIVFLVRKDAKKYARVKELLMMNEELKKARKAFDEGKFAGNEVPNNGNTSITK